MSINIISTE